MCRRPPHRSRSDRRDRLGLGHVFARPRAIAQRAVAGEEPLAGGVERLQLAGRSRAEDPCGSERAGDLNRRRGLVQGMDDAPAGKIVRAEVPLSEMFGYSTDLRSATQGRATYSMEFEKYSEAPTNIADAIAKSA